MRNDSIAYYLLYLKQTLPKELGRLKTEINADIAKKIRATRKIGLKAGHCKIKKEGNKYTVDITTDGLEIDKDTPNKVEKTIRGVYGSGRDLP